MNLVYILRVIDLFFQVYFYMILARILSSWFPAYQDHPIVRFIAFYTDPYLNLFRKIIPPLGMIDISPILAMYALYIIAYVLKYLVVLILR